MLPEGRVAVLRLGISGAKKETNIEAHATKGMDPFPKFER